MWEASVFFTSFFSIAGCVAALALARHLTNISKDHQYGNNGHGARRCMPLEVSSVWTGDHHRHPTKPAVTCLGKDEVFCDKVRQLEIE